MALFHFACRYGVSIEWLFDGTTAVIKQRVNELGCGSPTWLFLKIEIRERLPVAIADDETGREVLDRPGRWEAARSHCETQSSSSSVPIQLFALLRKKKLMPNALNIPPTMSSLMKANGLLR